MWHPSLLAFTVGLCCTIPLSRIAHRVHLPPHILLTFLYCLLCFKVEDLERRLRTSEEALVRAEMVGVQEELYVG